MSQNLKTQNLTQLKNSKHDKKSKCDKTKKKYIVTKLISLNCMKKKKTQKLKL